MSISTLFRPYSVMNITEIKQKGGSILYHYQIHFGYKLRLNVIAPISHHFETIFEHKAPVVGGTKYPREFCFLHINLIHTIANELLAILLNYFARLECQNKVHSMSYLTQLVARV